MEEALLDKERETQELAGGLGITWRVFAGEVKEVGCIAAPMVAVNLSTYFLQIVSNMMVGHLGKLALSSTAISISLCAVSGFSVLFGLSCALETLCGQAYGAKQYKKFGIQIYTGIFCLTLSCLPLSLLWIFLEKILILLGQDPMIAHEAGRFALCLIPALFAYAVLQALIRYFLMQRFIRPLVISACVSVCFHIVFCWIMVFKTGLGNRGAALAIGASYLLNAILLGLYMKYSPDCAMTRVPISMELFEGIREFFRFAIPSAVMICLQWWSFELLTLLSGLLPNPTLETSVLSICINTIATIYTIPEAFGSAASTKISNALGAGSPQAARVAFYAAMSLAAAEALSMSLIIFSCRHIYGYIYSNDMEVVNYVAKMAPLVSLSVIVDTLHGTLSGIARGSGWQHLGAYVNFGAYYLLGIPIAVVLGFWAHLRGRGLWVGILTGSFFQVSSLAIITSFTDWREQASKARERVFQGKFSVENGLV